MSAPLSPFYKSQDLIFVSGQVGIDSEGNIPADFSSQVSNALINLRNVLEQADSKLENTVKTTVFLTDLSQFDKFNDIYSAFFGGHKPARTTVGINELPRFEGDPIIHVEIEAIATQ